jgi:hypothetical protein
MNLDLQNKCLLSKQVFKLINEQGILQDLLRNNYMKDKTLLQVEKRVGESERLSFLDEAHGCKRNSHSLSAATRSSSASDL